MKGDGRRPSIGLGIPAPPSLKKWVAVRRRPDRNGVPGNGCEREVEQEEPSSFLGVGGRDPAVGRLHVPVENTLFLEMYERREEILAPPSRVVEAGWAMLREVVGEGFAGEAKEQAGSPLDDALSVEANDSITPGPVDGLAFRPDSLVGPGERDLQRETLSIAVDLKHARGRSFTKDGFDQQFPLDDVSRARLERIHLWGLGPIRLRCSGQEIRRPCIDGVVEALVRAGMGGRADDPLDGLRLFGTGRVIPRKSIRRGSEGEPLLSQKQGAFYQRRAGVVPSEYVVGERPEGEEIGFDGLGVRGVLEDLRRPIQGRPVRGIRREVDSPGRAVHLGCQLEVVEAGLGRAARPLLHQDRTRMEVPMDDALAVAVAERARDLLQDGDAVLKRQCGTAPTDEVLQRLHLLLLVEDDGRATRGALGTVVGEVQDTAVLRQCCEGLSLRARRPRELIATFDRRGLWNEPKPNTPTHTDGLVAGSPVLVALPVLDGLLEQQVAKLQRCLALVEADLPHRGREGLDDASVDRAISVEPFRRNGNLAERDGLGERCPGDDVGTRSVRQLELGLVEREEHQRLDPRSRSLVLPDPVEGAGEHATHFSATVVRVGPGGTTAVRLFDGPVEGVATDLPAPALDLDNVQGVVAEYDRVDLVDPAGGLLQVGEGPQEIRIRVR